LNLKLLSLWERLGEGLGEKKPRDSLSLLFSQSAAVLRENILIWGAQVGPHPDPLPKGEGAVVARPRSKTNDK